MVLSGETVTEEGDTIISEGEYLEITRLKDLKTIYRTHFDELKAVKAEVQYCQKLVDQCRQRLIRGRLVIVRNCLSRILEFHRLIEAVFCRAV